MENKNNLPAGKQFNISAVYSDHHESILRNWLARNNLFLISYGNKIEKAFSPTNPDEVAQWKEHVQKERERGTTERPDCLLMDNQQAPPHLDMIEDVRADKWVEKAICAIEVKASGILFRPNLNFTLTPKSYERMLAWKAKYKKTLFIVQSLGDQFWYIEIDDFVKKEPRQAVIGGVQNYLVKITEGKLLGEVKAATYSLRDPEKGKIDMASYRGGYLDCGVPAEWGCGK